MIGDWSFSEYVETNARGQFEERPKFVNKAVVAPNLEYSQSEDTILLSPAPYCELYWLEYTSC